LPEIDCNALLLVRHCARGSVSRRRIARQSEGRPAPTVPGDAVRNPAQVSFWLLEPPADAAMTYFYAQLFAMDTEIRAMFPAAMDVQRRRFFQALSHIAAAQESPAHLKYVPKNAKIRCQASSAASLSYFSRASAVSGAIGAGLGLMKLCPASG